MSYDTIQELLKLANGFQQVQVKSRCPKQVVEANVEQQRFQQLHPTRPLVPQGDQSTAQHYLSYITILKLGRQFPAGVWTH